jgi:hypothetical protein
MLQLASLLLSSVKNRFAHITKASFSDDVGITESFSRKPNWNKLMLYAHQRHTDKPRQSCDILEIIKWCTIFPQFLYKTVQNLKYQLYNTINYISLKWYCSSQTILYKNLDQCKADPNGCPEVHRTSVSIGESANFSRIKSLSQCSISPTYIFCKINFLTQCIRTFSALHDAKIL